MPSTQYRVYLTPFPFGSDATTVRPVIALTQPLDPDLLVLCTPVLSSLQPSSARVEILDNLDFLGLKTPSTVLLDSVVSLPLSSLQREIGYIPRFIRVQIEARMSELLDV